MEKKPTVQREEPAKVPYSSVSHLCSARRQTLRALRSCGSHAPCRLVPPLRWEAFPQQHLAGNTSQGTYIRTLHWPLPWDLPRLPQIHNWQGLLKVGVCLKRKAWQQGATPPAGLTCLKEAAAGMPNACLSSFTSCQALRASHRLMNPGEPFTTAKAAHRDIKMSSLLPRAWSTNRRDFSCQ